MKKATKTFPLLFPWYICSVVYIYGRSRG